MSEPAAILELPSAPPTLPYAPSLPKKPRVWPSYLFTFVLIGIRFALGYSVSYGAYYLLTSGPTPYQHYINYLELIRGTPFRLAGYFLMMLFSFLALVSFLVFRRQPLAVRLNFHWPSNSVLSSFIFALAGVALTALCDLATQTFQFHSKSLAGIHNLVMRSSPAESCFTFFVIAILGPFLEELFFRGYIQTRLTARHGAVLAIFFTSVLFGVFHFDLTQGVFAFVIGLFLGIIAHRTQSILPAFLCHAAINGVSVVESRLYFDRSVVRVPMLVACFIILPAAIYLLSQTKARPASPSPMPV